MVNKIILFGNIGRVEPLVTLEDNLSILKFPIVTCDRYRDAGGTWMEKRIWHNISVYGKEALRLAPVLKSGDSVYVEGSILSFDGKDANNNNGYFVDVIAEKIV